MDSLFGAAGLLVALFMIVAAVSEQVVEIFRDGLEQLGLDLLRAATPVDDAVAAASAFLPEGNRLGGRIEVLRSLSERFPREAAERRKALEQLAADMAGAAGPAAVAEVAARVAAVTAKLKVAAAQSERKRILMLRLLSLAVCLGLCWAVQFDALLAVATAFPDLATRFNAHTEPTWFGIVATSIAASGGSACWHDLLDRMRALKAASASLSAVVRR